MRLTRATTLTIIYFSILVASIIILLFAPWEYDINSGIEIPGLDTVAGIIVLVGICISIASVAVKWTYLITSKREIAHCGFGLGIGGSVDGLIGALFGFVGFYNYWWETKIIFPLWAPMISWLLWITLVVMTCFIYREFLKSEEERPIIFIS